MYESLDIGSRRIDYPFRPSKTRAHTLSLHRTYTRQQRRADERDMVKDLRHLRKVNAMKRGEPGGAAAAA
jgi:hypothetical protein